MSYDQFCGKRILISGGSGFVGTWMLESLLGENRRFGLQLSVVGLSRDVDRWKKNRGQVFEGSGVSAISGDVQDPREWEHLLSDQVDVVIHAAYDSGVRPGMLTPLQTLDSIIEGTRNVISAGVRRGARRVLFVSSGAVYGRMPEGVRAFSEDYCGGPDPLAAGGAYGEGKRAAEAWGAAYCREHGVEFVSARLFAFGGPYLPLDQHFAFGNFILDALAGRPIRVAGAGMSVRSWLYGGDLGEWLLRILIEGRDGRAYNVGSDEACTILELAHLVAEVAGRPGEVELAGGAGVDSIYVPDISRAREELGLEVKVSLREAIRMTLDYHRNRGGV